MLTSVVYTSKEEYACPWSRSGLAAERPRNPSVSAPHWDRLARPTGPGQLTYLIVPKVPKVSSLKLGCLKHRTPAIEQPQQRPANSRQERELLPTKEDSAWRTYTYAMFHNGSVLPAYRQATKFVQRGRVSV